MLQSPLSWGASLKFGAAHEIGPCTSLESLGCGPSWSRGGSNDFVLHPEPRPLPEVHFTDQGGRPRSLAEFKEKVVLLNVWATWCAPCRKEMPALDRLQAAIGGLEFEVVALSIDRAGAEPVRRFYRDTGIERLPVYLDSSGKVLRDVSGFGLPISLLVDGKGREIGRLVGPAEWDSPEVVAFLKEQVARLSAEHRPR